MTTHAAFEAQAREYLAEQLGERAPRQVQLAAVYDEKPLAGEGRTALFSFRLEPANDVVAQQAAVLDYYAAVGDTESNFYPAYGFSADDAYSLHIGTRFMLGMGVTLVEAAEEPPHARDAIVGIVHDHLPDAVVGEAKLATLMRCQDQLFAVYRLNVDDEPVYYMGADLPPGFYRLTEHPPQVALRLHLGKVIRHEARSEGPGSAS
jgi:hypothetical protein